MNLADRLKNEKIVLKPPRQGPLWAGPEDSGPLGGVTQSMLGHFLVDRERFRLRYIEGLKPAEKFSHRMHYGEMWHKCEEALAGTAAFDPGMVEPFRTEWEGPLKEYAAGLCKQFPTSQQQVDHWYNVCKTQFPIYVGHWRRHPDVKARKPLLQEQVFSVPIKLPSGRTVYVKGKWDSVDLVSKEIWLAENKTKGDINEAQLQRQLKFDLQTMLYLVTLQEYQKVGGNGEDSLKWSEGNTKVAGVRYNVVRRPLSGGKGSIVRHKATKTKPEESKEAFYQRVADIIRAEPETYFMRWNVEVSTVDLDKFRRQCLDPVLEQLCLWYAVIARKEKPWALPEWAVSWRTPYGLWMPQLEGTVDDLDYFLDEGSMGGLRRVDTLFGELEG
jgi:hypothetical protein